MDGNYPKIYLYRRLVQAKLFIDENFAENIDLDNIADEASYSKYYFIRQFKKVYGKTPHQYLISVRLKKATQLLDAGLSVSGTCFAVGFESISSFSGLFKKSKGLSPSIYLSQQRELKAQILRSPLKFIPGCHARNQGLIKKGNFEETTV